MQTVKIVQAVALMLIVAVAASCASTRAYTSKLFAPRTPEKPDSTATVLRFLETGDADTQTGDWVSTDIIMGRDTAALSKALDQFATQFPAGVPLAGRTDSLPSKSTAVDSARIRPAPVTGDPLARSGNPQIVRPKKTRED